MSKPKKEILETILEAAKGRDRSSVRLRAEKMIHFCYAYLCNLHSYFELEDVVDINLAGTGSSGKIIPADCLHINKIEDVTYRFEYHPRDASELPPNDYNYRYYVRVMQREALFRGTDGTLLNGGITFLSTSLTSDLAGEYVQFGNELGLYKLTAAKTFTPRYWGPSYTGNSMEFSIRPKNTRTLFLVDRSGSSHTSNIRLHYGRLPLPLYLDSDIPVLPTTLPLELMVLRELPEAKARRPVSKSEIKEAITECEMLDQRESRIQAPLGNAGFGFDFDQAQQPYEDRDDRTTQSETLP